MLRVHGRVLVVADEEQRDGDAAHHPLDTGMVTGPAGQAGD